VKGGCLLNYFRGSIWFVVLILVIIAVAFILSIMPQENLIKKSIKFSLKEITEESGQIATGEVVSKIADFQNMSDDFETAQEYMEEVALKKEKGVSIMIPLFLFTKLITPTVCPIKYSEKYRFESKS
jgi:hypothetical protein